MDPKKISYTQFTTEHNLSIFIHMCVFCSTSFLQKKRKLWQTSLLSFKVSQQLQNTHTQVEIQLVIITLQSISLVFFS